MTSAPDLDTAAYRTETLDACPLCGGGEWQIWAAARDGLMHRSEQVFTYARCGSCDLLFAQTRPTEDTVSFFYEGDYGPYGKGRRVKSPFRFIRKIGMRLASLLSGEGAAQRAIVARRNARLAKPGATVLDFGCGGGAFLDACKARFGVKTIGMDFNPSLFPALAAKGHVVLDTSPASWRTLPDSSVDLVVMNHVLEHLYHPRDVLDQVRRVLKPEGLVDIAVPNPDGYAAKTYRVNWFGLDSPRHAMLYTPAVAQGLLRELGFSDFDVIGQPVTRYVLRSMAREAGAGKAAQIEGDSWLALQTAPIIRREARTGGFDCYHLYARKGG